MSQNTFEIPLHLDFAAESDTVQVETGRLSSLVRILNLSHQMIIDQKLVRFARVAPNLIEIDMSRSYELRLLHNDEWREIALRSFKVQGALFDITVIVTQRPLVDLSKRRKILFQFTMA